MKGLLRFLTVITLCAIFACSKKDALEGLLLPGGGTRPAVLASYPTDGLTGIDPNQGIWILFDREMDQQKTQSAFTLSSASGSVTGGYRWDGTRMVFLPRAALAGADQFTMTVAKSAEASSGVDLEQDYIARFFAQSDISHPALLGSTPAHGASGVAQNQVITLAFSKPIDFASIASGLTISPAIVSTTTQNAAKDQIIITPSAPLTNGTTYTIQLTTNLKDASGNSLQSPQTVSFVVGTAFTPPSILSAAAGIALTNGIVTSNVDRMSPIVIQFSQPMNIVQTEAAITLSPSASWTKTWNGTNDQLTLSFAGGLSPQTNYTLSVANSAVDASGNVMSNGYSYPFVTDAAASVRPLITQVRQESSTSPGTCAGAAGTGAYTAGLVDFSPLDTAQLIDADPTPGTLCLIQLRIDFNNVMVRNSLLTSTSFTRIFDSSAGSVQIYSIITPGPTSGNYMILQLYGNPWPTAPGIPTYRLKISGGSSGAVDTNGNTMVSDYIIYFTF